MAAKKSASKKQAARSSAKRKAPVRKRQEPAGTGHAPESVPTPERTKDGQEVARSAANPLASRAGVIVKHSPPAGDDGHGKELGLADVAIETVDGARAHISLGKERTGPLTQSDLITIRKTLDQAIQETY